MGILDEDVARVRETTDLVAVASEHVALKRVGQRWMGLCPFHQEKTPSFSINPALGLWLCFGCQKSGDAITFVREVEHLDFVEAVERLAQRAGITLRYDDRRAAQDRSRKARLAEAVGAAIDFYHRLLIDAPEGGTARKYLRGRGFDGDAARRFQLGWAPEGWDGLSRHLQQRGFQRDDVVAAGLAFVNRANRLQDQFRSRLLFPIFDARGEPVGFGGRALGDEPLATTAVLGGRVGVVPQRDARTRGQSLDRVDEVEVLHLAHEGDGVTARVASEALVAPEVGGDVERRGLLRVERAQALPALACALERHVLADQGDEIGRVAHAPDVVVDDAHR